MLVVQTPGCRSGLRSVGSQSHVTRLSSQALVTEVKHDNPMLFSDARCTRE